LRPIRDDPGVAIGLVLKWAIMRFRPRFTIGWSMIAVAVIAYFCAFPELAVLLGIFATAVLSVSPVVVLIYLACRGTFRAKTGEGSVLPGPRTTPDPGPEGLSRSRSANLQNIDRRRLRGSERRRRPGPRRGGPNLAPGF
jgi:hypothetical protein